MKKYGDLLISAAALVPPAREGGRRWLLRGFGQDGKPVQEIVQERDGAGVTSTKSFRTVTATPLD